MARDRRFQWGAAYALTDLKEGVFKDEPAVFVGRNDSDMKRPTLCAVCGEPLGSKGYSTFFFMGPNGHGKDMMIGNGCIKERIREKTIPVKTESTRSTLELATAKFPHSGRWYGTFLHHCIAKPYVRNKSCAEKWDESILKLPGVKYIMNMIDELRNGGWALDAEMRLECGNVDLLATHPERGTIVFDWKSDLFFDNHEEYIAQVSRYMSELSKFGWKNISGYILWVKEERKERVPFIENVAVTENSTNNTKIPDLPIKCALNIEMNGGEGIRSKKMTEYSHSRPYGNEVSFYIPPNEYSKNGYNLHYLEASPYREGEHKQPFAWYDAEEGFHVNFICTKKRRSFTMTAFWKKIRPYRCTLEVRKKVNDVFLPWTYIDSISKTDEKKNDFADFEVSKINHSLTDSFVTHATLVDGGPEFTKTEWISEELQEGMILRLPLIDDRDHFIINIKTTTKPKNNEKHTTPVSYGILLDKSNGTNGHKPTTLPQVTNNAPQLIDLGIFLDNQNISPTPDQMNIPQEEENTADKHFTPGRIYKSGGKYYGIYKRVESDRHNTCGKVDVAEVDYQGNKISNLEWRYVYHTYYGKEYIFGITNKDWKVFTNNVCVGLFLKDMDRYGNIS